MKVKFFIFSMVLGLSLAMIGCDTITEGISSPPDKMMEETKPKQPMATDIMKKDDGKTVEVSMAPEGKTTKLEGSASMAAKDDKPLEISMAPEGKTMAPSAGEKMAAKATTMQPVKSMQGVQPIQPVQPTPEHPEASNPTITPAPTPATPQSGQPQKQEMASSITPSQEESKKVPPLSVKKDDQAEMAAEPPKVDAPKTQESMPIPELRIIYFEFDKSNIRGQFIEDIKANYEWIKQNPNIRIQLEGHADERGTNEYNLALGERRGNSVLDYLMALGANPEQFSVISFGEERPTMLTCGDEECYEKNRRVEFTRL